MQTSGNAQYVDLTTSTTKIINWMNNMNQYGLGIYIDSDSTDTSEDNPTVALNNFNLITYTSNSTLTNHMCS